MTVEAGTWATKLDSGGMPCQSRYILQEIDSGEEWKLRSTLITDAAEVENNAGAKISVNHNKWIRIRIVLAF